MVRQDQQEQQVLPAPTVILVQPERQVSPDQLEITEQQVQLVQSGLLAQLV